MEAIVLAGGLGTRLRNIVSDVPKPMALVAGRPFLELLLSLLRSKGITRAILSIGYMSDSIISHFCQRDIGIDLAYEVESMALGTGGAIRAALRHASDDYVFVFNGDTYLDLEVTEVARMWPGDRTPIVVARTVENTKRFGRLDVVNGRVSRFSESGHEGQGVINAGCYLIPTSIFSELPLPPTFSFERDFLAHRPALSLRAFITRGRFIDIGVPEDYYRAQLDLRGLV